MPNRIIYFDSKCGICNRLVQWVIARDKRCVFWFAPLGGKTAAEQLPNWVHAIDSVVVQIDGRFLVRSSAVISIFFELGGMWQLARLAYVIPAPIRDALYRMVARYRRLLWSSPLQCQIPTKNGRFLT